MGRMGERKTQDAGRRTQGKPEWDKGRKKTQDAGRRTQGRRMRIVKK